MDDGHALDLPFFLGLLSDSSQLLFSHLRVGVIIQGDDSTPFVVVSGRSDESHDRSGLGLGYESDQLLKIERFVSDAKHGLSSAHGRDEHDLVPLLKYVIAGNIVPVDRVEKPRLP